METQSRQCTFCGGKGYFDLSDGSKEKCKGMGNPHKWEVIQLLEKQFSYLEDSLHNISVEVLNIKRELEKLKQL